MKKKSAFSRKVLCLALFSWMPVTSWASQLQIGTDFWGWSSNFSYMQNATEFYVPVSLWIDSVPNFKFYGGGEQAVLSLSSPGGANFPAYSLDLSGLSDCYLGGEWRPPQGSIRPFVNIGFNLPTGNTNFQVFQSYIPMSLVDARDLAVTFGMSALAGLRLPDQNIEYGVSAGYMDPNIWNPTFGLPEGNVNFSRFNNTLILSVDRSQDSGDGRRQDLSFWVLMHDARRNLSGPYFQWGPTFQLDYKLQDPAAFSVTAGIQMGLPSSYYASPGNLVAETRNSRNIRFYLDPSYALGQVTLAAQVTGVLPSDYAVGTGYHVGGGWVLGLEPNWRVPLGEHSTLKLSAGFTKIIQKDGALTASLTPADVLYDLWKLGAGYELTF